MKDYLTDFCTNHDCIDCAYHYSYPYFCLIFGIMEVSYPWDWDMNIKLDNRKVAFLEGI